MRSRGTSRRLRLNRETLATLSGSQLRLVAGGTAEPDGGVEKLDPMWNTNPRSNAWTAWGGLAVCGGQGNV